MQEFTLPKFGDSYTLIGSWAHQRSARRDQIREDRALITQDLSRFYPHIFVEYMSRSGDDIAGAHYHQAPTTRQHTQRAPSRCHRPGS